MFFVSMAEMQIGDMKPGKEHLLDCRFPADSSVDGLVNRLVRKLGVVFFLFRPLIHKDVADIRPAVRLLKTAQYLFLIETGEFRDS